MAHSLNNRVTCEGSNNLSSIKVYRSYPQRWSLVASVAFLNIANYSHWISFASVSSKAAIFYQVSPDDITRIVTVSYGISIPFCLISTFVVAKYGLRTGLYIGGTFTFIGSLLCCLSTFPGIKELTNPSIWYFLSLLGQALTGIGSPFVACVPTKISQNWFEEHQRIIATTLLGISGSLGLVLGQGITPLFVQDPVQLPLMNIVWCIPALFGLILLFSTLKSSLPPTPPSRSAEIYLEEKPRSFLKSIVTVCKIPSCLIFIFTIGGAMGFISALEGITEELMCSLGYDNKLSGLCSAMVFIAGIGGSFVFGIICQKLKLNPLHLVKLASILTCLILISMIFVQQMRSQDALFLIAYTVFGFLSIGAYPLMLELAVEASYPIDETIMTSLLGLSSAIQGVIMLEIKPFLRKITLSEDHVLTCNSLETKNMYDFKSYIYFLNGYGLVLVFLFLFFNPKLNRTVANTSEIENLPDNKYFVERIQTSNVTESSSISD